MGSHINERYVHCVLPYSEFCKDGLMVM